MQLAQLPWRAGILESYKHCDCGRRGGSLLGFQIRDIEISEEGGQAVAYIIARVV